MMRLKGLHSALRQTIRRAIFGVLGLAALGIAGIGTSTPKAYAYGFCVCDGCNCTAQEFSDNATTNSDLHNETRFDEFGMVVPLPFYAYDTDGWLPIEGEDQGTERIGEHQEFIWQLWFDNFLPVWMDMAEQMTNVAMWHTFAIGTFLDAKIQLETQAVLQERMAEVHKRYQPSVGMCVFGTNIRSLAATERNSKLVSHTLNQRLLDRLLGTEGGSGVTGPQEEQTGRVRYFLNHVCDRFDNNRLHNNPATGFANICQSGTPRADGTVNLDIDFTRLIMNPRTLNVDFVNLGNANNQARHVFNLGSNLFGHKIPAAVHISSDTQTSLHSQMLDIRAAIAKRSVAQTSYSALVGLKARGTANSGTDTMQYMTLLLEELGIPKNDVADFIGERPSYYAQLEVLAKKIYQNPDFYRELYDKPENTRRKGVAMSAINSMLDREIFDSQLRAEAMISQLLELKVQQVQDEVEDSFSRKGVQ